MRRRSSASGISPIRQWLDGPRGLVARSWLVVAGAKLSASADDGLMRGGRGPAIMGSLRLRRVGSPQVSRRTSVSCRMPRPVACAHGGRMLWTRSQRASFHGEGTDALVGVRCRGVSGRVWTVRSVLANGSRVFVVSPGPDGECGAVIDIAALRRMVPLTLLSGESVSLPAAGAGATGHDHRAAGPAPVDGRARVA